MSAAYLRVGLRLLTVFYICISVTLCSKVVWKNTGDSITIQCRCKYEVNAISLKKGLAKNEDVFYKSKRSDKINFADSSQSEVYGIFPNLDIIMKNLTKNHTGVYWCTYGKYNQTSRRTETVDGEGSVLLVVTDPINRVGKSTSANHIGRVDKSMAPDETCIPSDKNLVVTSVVISATLLLIIFVALLLLVIRKVKYLKVENKPRSAPLNDVYEEMRGTIRR